MLSVHGHVEASMALFRDGACGSWSGVHLLPDMGSKRHWKPCVCPPPILDASFRPGNWYIGITIELPSAPPLVTACEDHPRLPTYELANAS